MTQKSCIVLEASEFVRVLENRGWDYDVFPDPRASSHNFFKEEEKMRSFSKKLACVVADGSFCPEPIGVCCP